MLCESYKQSSSATNELCKLILDCTFAWGAGVKLYKNFDFVCRRFLFALHLFHEKTLHNNPSRVRHGLLRGALKHS